MELSINISSVGHNSRKKSGSKIEFRKKTILLKSGLEKIRRFLTSKIDFESTILALFDEA